MLKLENVSKIYYTNGIVATGISKVNLELNIGEFVVITGESGSGKSTLLNVISGIDSYEEGEMYINGKETSHYTEKDFEEYRKKYIANIFLCKIFSENCMTISRMSVCLLRGRTVREVSVGRYGDGAGFLRIVFDGPVLRYTCYYEYGVPRYMNIL